MTSFAVESGVVVASARFRELLTQAAQVALSKASVLITGESGAGKEIVARTIHSNSLRKDQSWVDVNCTALPESLLESELFGYEKGAFSGAGASKPGLFELAHNGTLFLDEIGDLDLRVQSKLLRVLDGSPYYRLGGTRKIHVDTRMIAATNQDLMLAVDQKRFRLDLYHRLSQVHLFVPPLRERVDDIEPLAVHFLAMERPDVQFSSEAMDALKAYAWPGNTRELRNVVLRASIFVDGDRIQPADLPEEVLRRNFSTNLYQLSRMGEAERGVIVQTLAEKGGHQRETAKELGISRRTLQRRIKDFGLGRERAPVLAK